MRDDLKSIENTKNFKFFGKLNNTRFLKYDLNHSLNNILKSPFE